MKRPPIVADASVVLAALMDSGPNGAWANALLARHPIAAPHHMPVEATSALRKAVRARTASPEMAALALAELRDLRIAYYPFGPFAERTWELGTHVSSYDAWYVALAEVLDAPLVTLDLRLAKAHGLRCTLWTPATG